jgi:hypothetical protein
MTLTPIQQRQWDTGAAIMSEPPDTLDFVHAVFASVFLPYRDPGAGTRDWERRSGNAFLRIEAGAIMDPVEQRYRRVGLPYGTKARLILIHLTAEAIRTGSPVIEVENSLTAYVRHLGLATDGRAIHAVRDQLGRLGTATIRIAYADGNRAVQINGQIVKGLNLWAPHDPHQRVLWPSTVRLSDEYFEDVRGRALPLDHRAVGALSNSALALDAYVWLAARLCRVPERQPQQISWKALHQQFGLGFNRQRKFKETFGDTLNKVLDFYPNAKVEVKDEGVVLYRSHPPVARKVHRLG